MSNDTFLPCIQDRVIPHTVQQPNATQCECQVFYQGQLCEERIPWFDTMHPIRIAYALALTSYILVWEVAKLIYEFKQGNLRKPRLSAIALYALFIGSIGIVAHRINKAMHFKSPDYWYDTGFGGYYITDVVFAAFYFSLFVVAANLIISFWFTILTSKLRPKLAWRSRVVSIVMAAIVLVCCPIATILAQLGIGREFVAMLILPVLLDAVWFVTMTILVRQRKASGVKMDSRIWHKTRHASNIFAVLSALLIYYLLYLAALSFVFLGFPTQWALSEIILGFLNDNFEFAVQLCILLLIDRDGGIRKLFHAIVTGEKIASSLDRATNETGSVSSGGNSMGTKSSENATAASMSVNAPANSMASFADPKSVTLGAGSSTNDSTLSSD